MFTNLNFNNKMHIQANSQLSQHHRLTKSSGFCVNLSLCNALSQGFSVYSTMFTYYYFSAIYTGFI